MMHNLAVVTSAISSLQMIRVRRYFNLIINAKSSRSAVSSSRYLELQCWCWWYGVGVVLLARSSPGMLSHCHHNSQLYQVVATLDSEGRHLSWWTANMGGWCV